MYIVLFVTIKYNISFFKIQEFYYMNLKKVEQYNKKMQRWYAAKTHINFDIQTIGKNTRTIALPEKPSFEELQKGVFLKKDVINFADGNFTNVYNLSWNKDTLSIKPFVHSEKRPFYLLDYMEDNPSILALMSGSFFFLVDVEEEVPKDYPFHFCVRRHKIVGLPSSDEPILYLKNGELNSHEIKAFGTIQIGESSIEWVGENHEDRKKMKKDTAVLYNSGCSRLIKEYDPISHVRMGRLDLSKIHTPKGTDVVDLVVNLDKHDNLKISNINVGGGTHYFDGLFILQTKMNKNIYKVGDKISPTILDNLDPREISSAITIGKSVHDEYFLTPERITSRDARSVIAKDKKGNIHFVVFDGSKYIPKFNGVSAKDIHSYFSPDKYVWAYFLDGGSSSRIIVRRGKKLEFLANEFVYRKINSFTFLWDYKRHRKLASCVGLKLTKN